MSGALTPTSRAVQLLDCVADLHLGNITPAGWLHRMADITDSASATAVGFTPGNPATQSQYASDGETLLNIDAIAAIDMLIRHREWQQPKLIGPDTAPASALRHADQLADPRLMIGLLDWEEGCVALVLRSPDDAGWKEFDRRNFAATLPTMRKGHLVHRRISSQDDYLEVANFTINSFTRGVICFRQDMEITKANYMAKDILDTGDDIAVRDGKLVACNPEIAAEIKKQVAQIRGAPKQALDAFAWNRGFPSRRGGLCQISLRAHALSDYKVETAADDRFIVMNVYTTTMTIRPTTAQLCEFYQLTSAQAKVVQCLLRGSSPAEAAEQLHISVNTVRSHLRTIYSKLAVENQTDLIRTVSQTLVDYIHALAKKK